MSRLSSPKPVILVIDNYDSFTHNLVHLLRCEGETVEVHRNDRLSVAEVLLRRPRRIVISPGPGHPDEAGISTALVRRIPETLPLLGVCLGHQCIARAFGGTIGPAPSLVHGKTSTIEHRGDGLFEGLPSPFSAMRYHSLMVDPGTLPPELQTVAWLQDSTRTIMGMRHRSRPLFGIQFHPESFLTPLGGRIIDAFLGEAAEQRPAVSGGC